MKKTTATIHIDKNKYDPETPTTGAALYTLGSVAAGYDLFLEIPGHGDDLKISNDATPVELKNGMRFYTVKQTLNPGDDN